MLCMHSYNISTMIYNSLKGKSYFGYFGRQQSIFFEEKNEASIHNQTRIVMSGEKEGRLEWKWITVDIVTRVFLNFAALLAASSCWICIRGWWGILWLADRLSKWVQGKSRSDKMVQTTKSALHTPCEICSSSQAYWATTFARSCDLDFHRYPAWICE